MLIAIEILLILSITLCIISIIVDLFINIKKNKNNKKLKEITKLLDIAILTSLANGLDFDKKENNTKEKIK